MGQGRGRDDSVYDFLYVDQRRIGLLLSQFGQDGVLTELVREAASGSESRGGIDIKIIKVDAKDKEDSKLSRRFDPQWLIPLLFLDQTKERLRRDIEKAAIGALVLVEGDLWLTETSSLQAMYEKGALRSVAVKRARESAKAAGVQFDQTAFDLEVDLIARSPPQVQFHLHMAKGSVWSTLRPTGLITPPEEIASKHGVIVEGKWHVLGVKDAEPEPGRTLMDNRAEQLAAKYGPRGHLSDMLHTAEIRRRMFGRPVDAYGVIPLLIFRPVG